MTMRTALLAVALMMTAAVFIFQLFQDQFSGGLLNVALDPEIRTLLQQSMEDQKTLRRLDPAQAEAYRQRFDAIQEMQTNLLILEHNRDEIAARFQNLMLAVLGLILSGAFGWHLWWTRRTQKRLNTLKGHLAALSEGRADIRIEDQRRDLVGRIFRMIEETSRVMSRQRQRLASLQNLSAWQEAARRHAHEIRTPLTAARMELDHMRSLAPHLPREKQPEFGQLIESVEEEMDRLKDFTHQFTSFAKIGEPTMEPCSVNDLLRRFVQVFKGAWEPMDLRFQEATPDLTVTLDREMIRRVISNLCQNASQVMGQTEGEVLLSAEARHDMVAIRVSDTGPGIPESFQGRLFRPYSTTRKVGEGMGLGLAISRKIMLDHGGDLILKRTSSQGTTFELQFPKGADRDLDR